MEDNRVGTARCAVRAASSGATSGFQARRVLVPPAIARAGTSQRDVPTNARFNGEPPRFVIARWDHEPRRRRGNESLIFSENLASCFIRDLLSRLLRFMGRPGVRGFSLAR